MYGGAWSDAGPAAGSCCVGKYNAESPKQESKRFNCQVRRNSLPIWVYYLSMVGGEIHKFCLSQQSGGREHKWKENKLKIQLSFFISTYSD